MATPRQMTAHFVDGIKGWPAPHAVDFAAKLSANVTIDPFFAGRCVHLNASGEFETGAPDLKASGKVPMPMWTFQNDDDPDVSNDGGITGSEDDDPGGWMAVSPTKVQMALPAAGAYELETTEFESEASLGSVYEPNHCLQAVHANTNATTGGRMTKGTLGTHVIVGLVSKAVYQHKVALKNVLRFWPTIFPVYP